VLCKIEKITYAAFGKITKGVWTKAEEHVVKIEKECCKENCVDRSVIEPNINSIGLSSQCRTGVLITSCPCKLPIVSVL
jgi:hypothetical protein